MPTYEYRCPNGHEFERFFRSISAAAGEQPCPTCGAIGLRQLSGGAGLMFKGSGFYLTDYGKNAHARKGPAPRAGADTASGGDGAGPAAESGGAASAAKPGDAGGAGSAAKPAAGESTGGAAPPPKPKSSE
jgi:putative FmdB family regulatory protein